MLKGLYDFMGFLLIFYRTEIQGSLLRIWPKFQSALGTNLSYSTTTHLQADGQFEGTIHTLEDMLELAFFVLEQVG